MLIEIDFNSDEAIYMQLTNQIIMGIATSRLREGDPLHQYAYGEQSIFCAEARGVCDH